MIELLKQYFYENAKLMLCSSVELNEKNTIKLKSYFDKAVTIRKKIGTTMIKDFSNYSNEFVVFQNAKLKRIDDAKLEIWVSKQQQDSQEVIFLSAILKVRKVLK